MLLDFGLILGSVSYAGVVVEMEEMEEEESERVREWERKEETRDERDGGKAKAGREM